MCVDIAFLTATLKITKKTYTGKYYNVYRKEHFIFIFIFYVFNFMFLIFS